ncbi:CBS domain-containing protein [Geomobilimonas luticola]|uniref:Diguanylate cyclase n=1 Tax=Geomobilimonas luticola TaxID=1114878 RepID=A0ABS5SHG2_9BACT|nr:CBS domain-containing protein [Geomobilimonas luticola]MBT0654107.1 diguanylate cyclase [Geomobilimonas luticola]
MSIALHKTKISQIVSRDVITVPPDTPLVEAVTIMASSRISCLVVAARKRPLGIFTERDLVRVANRRVRIGSQPIGDLMTSPVVTIHGNLNVYEAYNLMLSNKIRHHVVVDHGGRLLGVMSQSDLINILGLEYFMEMRKVEQVMTRKVVTVSREVTLAHILERMAGPGISCVVVVDDNSPVGIVTERDMVRLVADGVALDTTPVGMVMNSPVMSVPIGTTVHKAATVMKQNRFRRILVLDPAGRIEGIITQSDIIKGLEGKYVESLKEIIREKEDIFQQTARDLLDKTIYLDNILSSSIDMAIVATDSEFRIKYFNPVAEKVFNCSASHAIGRTAMELHELEGVAPNRLFKAQEIIRKKGKHLFPMEMNRNGHSRYYDGSLSSILDKQKKLVGFVLMLRDVTEKREQEKTIHHLAYHDALTGLPNRVLLNDRLSQALTGSKRNGTRGALMILDLDRFKDINDTLGHGTGDMLLKAVSGRLQNILRKSDTVSRMGGDEFVLLLPAIASAASADVIAAKIVKAFRKPFVCDGHTLKVTASVGIADFPDDGEDEETLMKNADIALYRVKEQGRNNYQRYMMVRKK